MTQISDLVGYIDQAQLDPLGSTASFIPRRKKERPHARYGKRGIYVVMSPIKGLTPSGVFPGEKAFAFQCPPMNQFGEDGSVNFDDYDTVGKEQHSQGLSRALRTVAFDTIFCDYEPEFALAHDGSGVYPAQRALKDLCAIRDARSPFHLVAHQSNYQSDFEVDYAATLRSVSWNMQEPDAYYVSVSFTEFSTPDIQEFIAGSRHHPHLPASLPVARIPSNRNTLAKIAKFYYGDPSKWRVVAAANGMSKLAPSVVIGPTVTKRKQIVVPVLKTTKKRKK